MAKKKTTKTQPQPSKAPWHGRQGDVLVMALDGGKYNQRLAIPADAKDTTPEDRIVLAYGEVTGHAHAIPMTRGSTTKRKVANDLTYLENVSEPLVHEEHSAIPLHSTPPSVGTNFIAIQQFEYKPAGLQRVAD